MPESAIYRFAGVLPHFRFTVPVGRHILEIWAGDFCRFHRYPTNHLHCHENYHEVCLTLSGGGAFAHGNDRFPLAPGTLFFSEIHTPHEISSLTTRDLVLVFVQAIIRTAGAPITHDPSEAVVDRFLRGHRLVAANCQDLEQYVHLMCREGKSAFDSVRRQEAARLFLLDALDRLSIAPRSRENAGAVSGQTDIAGRALAFMDAHLNERPAVTDIARACFCSPRHLRRLFAAATGRSILDAMNERRVKLAAQQLLMRFTVAQVAQSLGFESLPHFSRLFKRYHGMNAKEFQTRYAPRPVMPKTSFVVKAPADGPRG